MVMTRSHDPDPARARAGCDMAPMSRPARRQPPAGAHTAGCRQGTRFRLIRVPLIVLFLLFPPPALSGRAGEGDGGRDGQLTLSEFRQRLGAFIADTNLRRSVVGLKIVRLDDSSTIAGHQSGTLLHPGSNMKLFTTAAALALLPPDFTFRTRVYCDTGIVGGGLRGNLYVIGGGDPLLDTADVDSLAGIVAASGIDRIDGDIVADLSRFDSSSWGKGWMWDDEPDPGAPFITPLAFNHATVSVIVRPGPRAGTPTAWEITPSGGALPVENTALTIARGSPDSLAVTRARGEDRIVVGGTMSLSAPPETTVLSVRSPADHFLRALKERLARRGIGVGGGLRAGTATGPLFLGAIARPLGPVLHRVNAMSDNFAAECLLKVIAAERSGVPGSADDGLAAVGEYLTGAGIAPRTMIMADGSGVSWYNAVAADDLTALLRDQYARPATFGAFYRSLASAGRDGTLGSRMGGTVAAGRLRGKTGTLTGVSAISGYLTTLANERLAYCIMINHFPGPVRLLRSLQDGLLADLVRLAPAP